MMKTVYHTLSCIENTVQLRNAGFIKWTNIYDTPFLVYHSTEVRERLTAHMVGGVLKLPKDPGLFVAW